MLERNGGELIARVSHRRTKGVLQALINENVLPGTTIHTDEFPAYRHVGSYCYNHVTVNHSLGEYTKPNGAGVNSIEGFWAQLKRGINGTHIHVSGKHLPKYLGEFEYRYNMRKVPHLMHSFAR